MSERELKMSYDMNVAAAGFSAGGPGNLMGLMMEHGAGGINQQMANSRRRKTNIPSDIDKLASQGMSRANVEEGFDRERFESRHGISPKALPGTKGGGEGDPMTTASIKLEGASSAMLAAAQLIRITFGTGGERSNAASDANTSSEQPSP